MTAATEVLHGAVDRLSGASLLKRVGEALGRLLSHPTSPEPLVWLTGEEVRLSPSACSTLGVLAKYAAGLQEPTDKKFYLSGIGLQDENDVMPSVMTPLQASAACEALDVGIGDGAFPRRRQRGAADTLASQLGGAYAEWSTTQKGTGRAA